MWLPWIRKAEEMGFTQFEVMLQRIADLYTDGGQAEAGGRYIRARGVTGHQGEPVINLVFEADGEFW